MKNHICKLGNTGILFTTVCMRKHRLKENNRSRLLGAVMAGLLKKTTGLVGLAVCETPHERLNILYTKILDVLGHIPKNATYRKYTEQITNEKLSIVKAEPDVKKLEEQLQGGQIEEVILQGTGMQKEELKRYLE